MRIPYYLAQYYHARSSANPRASIVPMLAVGGVVLLYVGTLAVLLMGGWA